MPRIRNVAWRIAVSSASPLRARRHLAHLVARTQRRERPDEGRGCPVADMSPVHSSQKRFWPKGSFGFGSLAALGM